MRAAEKLFTSRRFHEITMDHVAEAAGVAKGTLYGHFRDKDDLFFQICTSGFDELCELIPSASPRGASFEQRLLATCRRISQFMDRRRELMRMTQAEENRLSCCKGGLHDRWMDKRRKLVSAVETVLAEGVAQGKLRRDISLEVLANVLLGMLRTRGRRLADAPPSMRRHEVIVELFFRGATQDRRARSAHTGLADSKGRRANNERLAASQLVRRSSDEAGRRARVKGNR
jgi:AcrR family transcriptional regulator